MLCLLSLKLVMEPKEEEISVLWKGVEQVYRFGLGSVAGGEIIDPCDVRLLISRHLIAWRAFSSPTLPLKLPRKHFCPVNELRSKTSMGNSFNNFFANSESDLASDIPI